MVGSAKRLERKIQRLREARPLASAWTLGNTTYVLPPINPVPEADFVLRLM